MNQPSKGESAHYHNQGFSESSPNLGPGQTFTGLPSVTPPADLSFSSAPPQKLAALTASAVLLLGVRILNLGGL